MERTNKAEKTEKICTNQFTNQFGTFKFVRSKFTAKFTDQCASRGQVSTEMLIVIAFFLLIMIPVVGIALSAAYSETWRLDVRQSDTVVKAITNAADKLKVAGEGATMQYTAYFPSRVKELKTKTSPITGNNVLTVIIETPQFGDIEQVAVADVNITLAGNQNQWKEDNIRGVQVLSLKYSKGNVTISKG